MVRAVDAPPELQDLAKRIAAILREELGADVTILWFGSWATGNAVPRSDLDIAVDVKAPLLPAVRNRLEQRIEELRTLRKVDVVDLATAGSELRTRVFAEGTPL